MDEPEPMCACGGRTQVVWCYTWERYLCVACRAQRTARELSEPVTALPAEAPPPTAYCAPGQKAVAEAVLAVRGERVQEVVEHPFLAGQGDVVLVADIPDPGPLSVVLAPLMCPRCGWATPSHSMFCSLFPWSAVITPSGPLIAGLPGI